MDRKLPILGSIAGLLVLSAVVALVLGGKYSDESTTPSATSSPPKEVAPASPRPSVEPPATSAIPEPPPTAMVEETPVEPSPPKLVATPKPVAPKPAVPPPAPAGAKKNCDPPYTIDAAGRKKYKLDCL